MRNIKLLLGILIIGMVSFLIGIKYIFFIGENSSNQDKHIKEKNNLTLPESNIGQKETEITNKEMISKINQDQNIFTNSNFLTIVSLKNAPITEDKKIDLLNKINNLYKFGSLSGGKITHEFSNI
ncbi:hypothetical protein, partial [Acinetobacter sp. Res13-Abat-PEC06-P4-01]